TSPSACFSPVSSSPTFGVRPASTPAPFALDRACRSNITVATDASLRVSARRLIARPVGSGGVEHRHLGRSGLRVSRMALGTMTWGADTEPDEAANLLAAFTEAGGTLVDTADVYADGEA